MSAQASLNFYSVLEIPQHASQEEIEQAVQTARTTYSLENPDIYKVFSHSEALAWNQLVENAYQTLGHPARREAYNQQLTNLRRIAPTNINNFSIEEERRNSLGDSAAASSDSPKSVGKTSLSQYSINADMEAAIESQDTFDGLFLKKIRCYKNIDVQAFVRKTCIAQRHIFAIENNNYSVLPAPVFVRGYIIQYCRILNLDDQKVVPSFMNLLANDRSTKI